MGDKVSAPEDVVNALETIRGTGVTNMFDVRTVLHLAKVMGYTSLVDWINNNRELYPQGIMNGFTPIPSKA